MLAGSSTEEDDSEIVAEGPVPMRSWVAASMACWRRALGESVCL